MGQSPLSGVALALLSCRCPWSWYFKHPSRRGLLGGLEDPSHLVLQGLQQVRPVRQGCGHKVQARLPSMVLTWHIGDLPVLAPPDSGRLAVPCCHSLPCPLSFAAAGTRADRQALCRKRYQLGNGRPASSYREHLTYSVWFPWRPLTQLGRVQGNAATASPGGSGSLQVIVNPTAHESA